MSSLRQICYDLMNIVSGGVQSDDFEVNYRQVAFWVKNTRALLIRQDIAKNRSISENITQSLGCVAIDWADRSECCDINVDCDILRTTVKIPKPIEGEYRDLITHVGPVDMLQPAFNIVPYGRIKYANTKFIKAFYYNGYVYIINSPFLEKINIRGVFEDPTEVAEFYFCDGTQCYNDDKDYPISSWMIEYMKKMIIDTDLRIITGVSMDKKNDASGKIEQETDKK